MFNSDVYSWICQAQGHLSLLVTMATVKVNMYMEVIMAATTTMEVSTKIIAYYEAHLAKCCLSCNFGLKN